MENIACIVRRDTIVKPSDRGYDSAGSSTHPRQAVGAPVRFSKRREEEKMGKEPFLSVSSLIPSSYKYARVRGVYSKKNLIIFYAARARAPV